MAKRGKRKKVQMQAGYIGRIHPIREPSGRPSRALAPIEGVSPNEARRLRDAAARGVAAPEWGSELGRLFLAGSIDGAAYEAGKMWGRLINQWYRAIGACRPYPSQGPIAFLGTVRALDDGEDPPVDSKEGKRILADRRKVIRRMQEAHAVLVGAGMLAEAAVRGVCEANECSSAIYGLDNLVRGLDWLAKHWGLTK